MPAVDEVLAGDHAADLNLLLAAAREAGRIALGYFNRDNEVWMKAGSSPVSEADYAVDAFLRDTLLSARPDYGWLSEETVDGEARLSARRTFVVDPIDGTRGFLAGSSAWCISLAVVEQGSSLAGVLECPARQETFEATHGGGAFRNGARLAEPAGRNDLEIGGPRDFFDALPGQWRQRARRAAHVPSLAYRLAMVAKGELDGTFVKPNAHDWDLAAADLILRESGGRVLDRQGSGPSYAGREIRHGALAAGRGDLLGAMVGVIGRLDR